MPNSRDWRSFNEAWRHDDPARDVGRQLYRVVKVLSWPLRHPHQAVIAAEPWGILFAVIGLFFSLIAFAFDYSDKIEERKVSAWQLITTKASGNSGKTDALEYLNKLEGIWCNRVDCVVTLKLPESFHGIDLSPKDSQSRTYLVGANLRHADFNKAKLNQSDLLNADLWGATFKEANLRGANLRGADLSGALFDRADLAGADLSDSKVRTSSFYEANLNGAYLLWADLSGSNLSNARNLDQDQLRLACGDEKTLLPGELKIPMCAKVDWFDSIQRKIRKLYQ